MNRTYTKVDIPEITDKFNKNIKKIIQILDLNIVNNVTLDTLKRQLMIVMKETPLILLQEGGGIFYSKRDYIYNDNLDELFSIDLSTLVSSDDMNKVDVNYKGVDELFNLIKQLWVNFNDNEKKKVNKLFKNLLSEYSKYKLI